MFLKTTDVSNSNPARVTINTDDIQSFRPVDNHENETMIIFKRDKTSMIIKDSIIIRERYDDLNKKLLAQTVVS